MGKGAGVTITVCTHPQRCTGMEAAHSDMAAQLAALTVERDRLAAQVARLEAQAEAWQAAYQGMTENYAWYFEAYKEQVKGAK